MSYNTIKIAIGIRLFPGLTANQLASELKMPTRTIYKYYCEAEMISRSWLPNLVTREQLLQLSGSELTVLYYLYTADPEEKAITHCYNLQMSLRTFKLALRNLRNLNLLETGTNGKVNYQVLKPREVVCTQIV